MPYHESPQTPTSNHENLMDFAIKLAEAYKGRTRPNPTVGAVVARNGRIVGFGAHKGIGFPHAEVVALNEAGELARGADMYVTLEPHSFHGTTPPCTDAIIKAGIKRVFVASIDPNPMVNGKGIEKLRSAGIEVKVGIREQSARKLNEGYFKFHEKGLPWVTIKIATSLDGFIADYRGDSKWISSQESRLFVHRLRGEHDAVVIGAGTVRKDNPYLTSHNVFAFYQPIRIVLSNSLNFSWNENIFNTPPQTVIITKNFSKVPEGVNLLQLKDTSPHEVLKKCAEIGIQSVLIEGGATVFSQFIESNLWDRLIIVYAPIVLGKGTSFAQSIKKSIGDPLKIVPEKFFQLGRDLIAFYSKPKEFKEDKT